MQKGKFDPILSNLAMNRLKFAPLISRAEWRSLEGAQLQSPSPFSAVPFTASCSFHSTAALERKRKNQWHYRFDNFAKRKKNRNRDKRALFRNISDYAEFLFQSWREEEDRRPPSRPSWFRGHHWVRDSNRTNGFYHPHGSHNSANFYRNNRKSAFDSSTSDDEEVETIFQSTFGGERFSYWSFDFSNTTSRNFRNSRKWSYDSDDSDEDENFGISRTKSEMVLARETLGLSISGPLKLEEVKSAYRICALRWHPDRHHGSSKVEAEEKFKHCSAAYKTLCDNISS